MLARLVLIIYGALLLMLSPLAFHFDTGELFAEESNLFEFSVTNDVSYNIGPQADPERHLLDIYQPVSDNLMPVLMFVHGGGWDSGDKVIYSYLGQNFASLGFTTVIINYRLSPDVLHPAHAEDVASAFAWVYQNIDQYGGDRTQIFLSGHSAGGHLASLIALDEGYLEAHGLSTTLIRGVAGISGVYDLTYFPNFLFFDTFPMDDDARESASPITHVDGSQPPFLILYAQFDYPTLDDQARDLSARLNEAGSENNLLEIEDENHISIIFTLRDSEAPTTLAILNFLEAHLSE